MDTVPLRVLAKHRYPTGEKIGKGGLNMGHTLTTFDMAALLDSDEAISEYLSQVLTDGDNEEFLRAIGYVIKACDQPGHAINHPVA